MTVKELKEFLKDVDDSKEIIFDKVDAVSLYDGYLTPIMERVETFTERKIVVVLG